MTRILRRPLAAAALAFPLLLTAAPGDAQTSAADGDSLPPPWEAAARQPGEPARAPLLRLRALESAYRANDQWWGMYRQIRAQAEAGAGSHAAALRFWDGDGGGNATGPALPDGARAVDAVALIAAAADTARVVMVNERHHAASDRLLTLRLLPLLYATGYRYFAAEALNVRDTALHARGHPVDELTGTYTGEVVFGEVVREALRLGYTLVPYEIEPAQDSAGDGLTPQQRRDRAQAQNLFDRTLARDPGAKVLVHAGFAHVKETPTERWYPMAAYFREIAGVDPVTVDQTELSERSTPAREHPAYRAAVQAGWVDRPVVLVGPDGAPLRPGTFTVDLQVLTPRTTYTRGRPDWMTLGGRRAAVDVPVPECAARTCWVEARPAGEPDPAVPLDRAEATEAETVRLYLPPGQPVRITVMAEDGSVLRSWEAEEMLGAGLRE